MLVTFALLQVTEVNGSVIREIVDVEDTTETEDIGILKGKHRERRKVDECERMCTMVFKGTFKREKTYIDCKLSVVTPDMDWGNAWCKLCTGENDPIVNLTPNHVICVGL
eukprot:Nk52_evm1s2170 gene=Nk52_evmTU1s2170